MKIAISIWEGRIAPVFDVSARLLLVDTDGSGPGTEEERRLERCPLPLRAATLSRWGVQTLICGAVSRPLLQSLEAAGIEVHAFIAGEHDKVLDAFLRGDLESPDHFMPGCGRQERGRCGRAGEAGRKRGRGGRAPRRWNGRGGPGGPAP